METKGADNYLIKIPLPNGCTLVVERNPDVKFSNEVYVGIVDCNDVWVQDLTVIRPHYEIDDDLNIKWDCDRYEVLVWGNKDSEDYTDRFEIERYINQ